MVVTLSRHLPMCRQSACVTRSFFVNAGDYDNFHLVEVGFCCKVRIFVVGHPVVIEG
jgi:hypothetical protein